MEEQLISFDTAKLAKEKGFDLSIKDVRLNNCLSYDEKGNLYGANFLAPTQSLLQNWLVNEYKIYVIPFPHQDSFNIWFCKIIREGITPDKIISQGKHPYTSLHSYEEALEKGLQEALKLIK